MEQGVILGIGLLLGLLACNSTHKSVDGFKAQSSEWVCCKKSELDTKCRGLEPGVLSRVFVLMPSQSFSKSFEVEVHTDYSLLIHDEFGRAFEVETVEGLESAWGEFQERASFADTYLGLGSGPEESITGQVGTIVVYVQGDYGMRCIVAPLMDSAQLASGSELSEVAFALHESIMNFLRSLRLGQSGLAESNHLDWVLF